MIVSSQVFRKIANYCLVLALGLVCVFGCRSAIPASELVEHSAEATSGVYLSGNHVWMNYYFYFGGGPVFQLEGDQGQYFRRELKWREQRFLALDPGRYALYVFVPWLGRAGQTRKCFDIGAAEILTVEYDMPWMTTSSGDIEIEETWTGKQRPVLDNCS